MIEQWKWVPGFEDWFKVSSWGRLRRFRRVNRKKTGGYYVDQQELMNPKPVRIGNQTYSRAYLSKKTNQGRVDKDCSLHQLVMQAFVGPCPDGRMVCHNDGDGTNNILSNLRYGTNQENQLDRREHGTSHVGAKNPNSSLTNDLVAEIRRLYTTGEYTQQQIADTFRITRACVCDVVRYKTYPNVGPDGEELDLVRYESKRKARPTKTYTFDGKTLTMQEWVKETGVSSSCLEARLRRGWTVDRALTTPAQQRTPDC